MGGFEAELYLRLLGERMLLERRDDPSSPLLAAAQALLAIGALAQTVAEAVARDYADAMALRSGEPYREFLAPGGAQPAPQPPSPRRVVPVGVELAGGLRVRHLALAADETTVAVAFPAPAGMGRRAPLLPRGGGGWQTPQPTLADDRGNTTGTDFSGGGGSGAWQGHLTAHQPLHPDTAWIEIDGTRLALGPAAAPADVSIEPLPHADPALRHLWRLAMAGDRFHSHDAAFEPAVDALAAAGALDPADPAVGELRAAVAAMGHGHTGTRVPEPWRSVLAGQARGDGPEGTLAIAALTPEFDGIVVAVTALESSAMGWQLEVDVTPDVVMTWGFQGALRGGLAWWAADDRGNRYVGGLGSWSGHDDRGHGEIAFAPALDPRAQRLEITPIAETQQAVIRVDLDWSGE